MSHIVAKPETIRMRSPAAVSGSGREFAEKLFVLKDRIGI